MEETVSTLSMNNVLKLRVKKAYEDRPICLSHGCDKQVCYSTKTSTGLPVWRPHCSRCHAATGGRNTFAAGVRSAKKDYCENIDGRLGFECTATIISSCQLDLDHIDGDHFHNKIGNVQTLCKNCHSYKTKIEGDSVTSSNQRAA